MPLPVFVVVGIAVAAKVATVGYVARIATSPTSEQARIHLLDHAEEILKKLGEIKRLPSDEKILTVRTDIIMLRKNIGIGWVKPEEFAAASAMMNFILISETKCTLSGVGSLLQNVANKTVDAIFPQKPHDPGNIHN